MLAPRHHLSPSMATQNTINLVLADDMIYFALICCLDRGYFYQFAFLGKLLEGARIASSSL